jgi:hypothetical protein
MPELTLSAQIRGHNALRFWGGAALLLALNVWIAHGLFSVEFLGFQSNEAAFISLGRIYRDHWRDLAWFPFFDCGMPIENAYQPLLPALTAALSGIFGLSIGRAFHMIAAAAYCLGPVTLFWFCWEWSGTLAISLIAGLLYSLVSPAAILFPAVRAVSGGAWTAQRLFNVVYYGEDPHSLALTVLPVGLLFLHRLAVRRDGWSFIGAVISCGAVVTTNAFGAASVALGAVCTALALGSGFAWILAAGVVSWCLVSPWIPPALLGDIQSIALSTRGFYQGGWIRDAAIALVLVLFGVIWWLTRRMESRFARFVLLFAPWMCAFPIAFYAAEITLVPQPHRYQLELEMAVCLVLAVLCGLLLEKGMVWRGVVAAGLAALMIHQIPAYRKFAHDLIRPVEITQTAEYRLAKWIDVNMPGERVMVSGDAAWLFNVYSDNPQMSAGHDASTPNFMQQVAVYQLYTGMNAGERDAEVSLFWLKAFGNQAITIPGAGTAEIYKPYVDAGKFEHVLPVLMRDHGDTIYEVPERSRSLFHVIPAGAVVTRQPVHGLDLEPARAYVAALDDGTLPVVKPEWQGLSKVAFRTNMTPGQVIAVQMNYAPGWRARVGGNARTVRKDGLGMMIVDPQCNGDCAVEMEFGATAETWICRVLSGAAALLLLAFAIRAQ